MRRLIPHLVAACLMLMSSRTAYAVQIYTYTGSPFTTVTGPFTTADFVTVTFSLTEPLSAQATTDVLASATLLPDSVSASGGPVTLSLADSTSSPRALFVTTDVDGSIIGWEVLLQSEGIFPNVSAISTCFDQDGTTDTCGMGNPGAALDGAVLSFADFSFGNLGDSGTPGTWSVVPEPSTLLLSALGLCGLGALRHARRACVHGG